MNGFLFLYSLFDICHFPRKTDIFIQISARRCLWSENVNCDSPHWSQRLYETKAAELVLYGRALGLSHAEAEDVLQETFIALMKLEHYCVRSFRNRALNYRRSLWRRMTRELESWRWFERNTDETPAEREAMRCLAELPMDQREVIVLKIWQRRTFEEIGDLLEISPNTAAGRYRYGLQKLKVRLEGEDYERERDESTGKPTAFLATAPAIPEN
jgi:RNA polymerase sigma-70 factor, ECF subfamily